MNLSVTKTRLLFPVIVLTALLAGACSSVATTTPTLQPDIQPVHAPTVTASSPTATPAVSSKPAFVEFFSALCAPCRQMVPTISRLEDEYEGRVDFLVYDYAGLDEATRQKYKFYAVPQYVLIGLDGGIAVTRMGFQSYETLKADLDSVLASQ